MSTSSHHVLVCSDFDGTITMQDTGCMLFDHCMGKERRVELDESVFRGEMPLREAYKEMWKAVNLTIEEAHDLYKDVQLDPKFRAFANYCFEKDIPFVVITAGPYFLIQNFLKNFFPEDYTKFKIESNYGSCNGRKWKIGFHDESEHGHDKGLTMKKVKEEYSAAHNGAKPFTVFCGDGVSDLSAARKADMLFVRRGRALEPYCRHEQIPHTPFDNFQIVLDNVEKLKE
ncbi:hypothetical protein DSO57_1023819 [Entomophthora muscae]|uniref:Uncharacterized protein n=2 Tax=Entomophthora muscae TaxID=34485 RepID=A0ACC2UC85_9FUNG|nr:hypothetical protein DSO57_1023819 [Entomophthora muscae]